MEDIRLYFSALPHTQGEWAKPPAQRIRLEGWQCFTLGSVLGWRRLDGTRRFRFVYEEVARKNAKSTKAAGLGMYLAFMDGEPGAEVYSAAVKRDQAKIVWLAARRMVLGTPKLRTRINVLAGNLNDPVTASKFEPLGADADSTDGLNVHAAIVDELHAHKTREMLDVLVTATGARRQPLIFIITTAGSNLAGVCYDTRTYITKILEGVVDDDAAFGVIYTIDDTDDWGDERCWFKANPNLHVSVKLDGLREEAKKAKATPAARAAFLTKRLNVWVNADLPFFDMTLWARAAMTIDPAACAGDPCYLGLDLASKSDLAAMIAVWLRDGHVYVATRFYLPRELVLAGAHAEMAHFAGWAAAGHLTLTEGNLIDFGVIREDIKALAKLVSLQEIGYDPYQATQIVTELSESGLALVEIPQTVKQLSGPMKAVRDLLRDGKLHHDGNPVMAWCVSNVVAHEDANENVFPRKSARALKIDGFTALLAALARPLVTQVLAEARITVLG